VVAWADAAWLDAVGPCLTADEEAMAARLGAARRAGFVLVRTLARRTVARALGLDVRDVRIDKSDDGRPLLPTNKGWISLTHTTLGGRAVAGVALADVPVGLDVEPVRLRAPGLAARILADGEALPAWPTTDDARLLAAWTAKEAALKADGLGLRQGAIAARIAWGEGGAFTATTPGGRWAGQGVEAEGAVWAVAWATE